MTRAILPANGEGSRWGNYLGVRKQELLIEGEPLIGRAIRLLRENGISDIFVSGPFEGYGAVVVVPEADADLEDGSLSTLPWWDSEGRTLIVYPDVWFSDEAMASIVAYDGDDCHYFGRLTPSAITAKPWPEVFAYSFPPKHRAEHARHLRRTVELKAAGRLSRAMLWETYYLEHGYSGAYINADGSVVDCGNVTTIDDWTEDFDFPADYDRYMAQRELR